MNTDKDISELIEKAKESLDAAKSLFWRFVIVYIKTAQYEKMMNLISSRLIRINASRRGDFSQISTNRE